MKIKNGKILEKPMYLNEKIHIDHFNEVAKSGINAVRLYLYSCIFSLINVSFV